MFNFRMKNSAALAIFTAAAWLSSGATLSPAHAADHVDAPAVTLDPSADIGDIFAFLNPNDNSKVILAMNVQGFIVPSQLLNMSVYSSDVVYRFEIENSGDAVPDLQIEVRFSPQISRTQPQTATIRLPGNKRNKTTSFTAPTTVQTLAATANPFAVTTDPVSGVRFFAGLADDPFYFDIVGFGRFVGSVLSGAPNVTRLQRGRDSFAGYNNQMIALEVPAAMLRGPAGDVIGVSGVTLRRKSEKESRADRDDDDDDKSERSTRKNRSGKGLEQIDRMGVPTISTVLIPFARKDEYNTSTPVDDAAGVFAGDIVATLTALGTNPTNIGILANVAVTNGDYLRLNLSTPNTSLGFGERLTTPGYTGFPNGRRLGDDTIDVVLSFVSNQTITQGDNVNSNEVPLGTVFPFFAPPHQPLQDPAVDLTRN